MLTADAFANRFVEQEFVAWADAVGPGRKATHDAARSRFRW